MEEKSQKKKRRKLRGSDFLMRWSQGAWSEDQLINAINEEKTYFALPYGPSGVAPDNNVDEYEKYFERLDAAGLGKIKRPDLLIFRNRDEKIALEIVEKLGGIKELPFHSENNSLMKELLTKAIIAVECENSLWEAKKMPHYTYTLKPQKRLKGQLGLAKSAVLPTIIMKEEDKKPLGEWQALNPNVELHIWHAFFDEAFGISYKKIIEHIESGLILGQVYEFANAGQSSTKKIIYKVPYYLGYKLAVSEKTPDLKAQVVVDKNGHIFPYVVFSGGSMKIQKDALDVLKMTEAKLK